LAGRQGGDRKSSCKVLQDEPQGKSADLAAESVGWSGETYRKAKAVVDSGNEDAKAAMDSGEASVHKAYTQARKTEEDKEEKRTWSLFSATAALWLARR